MVPRPGNEPGTFNVWKLNLNWDEMVPEEVNRKWNGQLRQLVNLHTIKVDRCLSMSNKENVNYDLVTFTDASKSAYSAVGYLREDDEELINTSLVFSKSRLSPIKSNLSIPRLELLGEFPI